MRCVLQAKHNSRAKSEERLRVEFVLHGSCDIEHHDPVGESNCQGDEEQEANERGPEEENVIFAIADNFHSLAIWRLFIPHVDKSNT